MKVNAPSRSSSSTALRRFVFTLSELFPSQAALVHHDCGAFLVQFPWFHTLEKWVCGGDATDDAVLDGVPLSIVTPLMKSITGKESASPQLPCLLGVAVVGEPLCMVAYTSADLEVAADDAVVSFELDRCFVTDVLADIDHIALEGLSPSEQQKLAEEAPLVPFVVRAAMSVRVVLSVSVLVLQCVRE